MSKNENSAKLKKWISEKRFYIMLLCCIMFLAIAYAVIYRADMKNQIAAKPDSIQNGSEFIASEPIASYETDSPPDSSSAYIYRRSEAYEESDKIAADTDTAVESSSGNIDTVTVSYEKPADGSIDVAYSPDTLVYSKTLCDWRVHPAIDIKTEDNADVKACADGVICEIYTDDAYGISVKIEHADGNTSIYQNLSNASLINKGDIVKKGQVISSVGHSAICESAQEPHLHFALENNGESIAPDAYIDFN